MEGTQEAGDENEMQNHRCCPYCKKEMRIVNIWIDNYLIASWWCECFEIKKEELGEIKI